MLEKIKSILGEELSNQVEAKLTEAKVEIGISNDGTLVPAEKHDGMKAELKANQDQLAKLQEQIKGVEGKDTTIEELKANLEKANADFELFKTDAVNRETTRNKLNAVIKLFEGAGALKGSEDLLAKEIDLESVQLDKSGNIVDSDDIVNSVKTKRTNFFGVEQITGQKPIPGNQPIDATQQLKNDYDLAMKSGNMAEAIGIKNKLFAMQTEK